MFLNNYRRFPTVTLGLSPQEAADLVRACLRPGRSACTTEAVGQGGWLNAALVRALSQYVLMPSEPSVDDLLEVLEGFSRGLEVECTMPELRQLLDATDGTDGSTGRLHHQVLRCLMHVSGMAVKPRLKDREYPLQLDAASP